MTLSCKLMSNFVDYKLKNRSIYTSPLYTENFTVEFICNNPSDKSTIPNRMLKKIRQILSETTGNESEELLEILKCTICIRPFSQEMFVKQLSDVLKFALEDLDYEKLQMVYFSVKSLSLLMCPKNFLNSIGKSNF